MAVNPEPFNAVPMLIGMTALYLLPFLISVVRGHHNKASIFFLNLFLGWTFIGWIAALIWSVSAIKSQTPAQHKEILVTRPDREDPYSKLEKLAELRDRGHLTAQEFEAEKSKVLGR